MLARRDQVKMMANRYVLTLDLGSSGLQATIHVMDRPWEVIATSRRRYRLYRPRDPNSLSSRFIESELWSRIQTAVASATQGLDAKQIVAVGITAQRGGTAFLDRSGSALYLAPNTDLRAVFEGVAIDDAFGAEVYATTGHTPSLFLVPAKLLWWRSHHPRIAQRIAQVTTLGGWAALRLTGNYASVPSELSEAGLLDATTRMPAVGLLDSLGFGSTLLAPVQDESTPVGTITRTAAKVMGLREGVPVYLTGSDTHTAVLSVGAVNVNDLAIVAGWSTPAQLVTDAPVFDGQRRTWTGPHLDADRWYVEASAGDTGGTLDMVRTLLGSRALLDRLDTLLAKSRRGANMVTGFWGPHAYNLSDTGVAMGGLLVPVPITYNQVLPAHMARATVENIAYALRECAELAVEVSGATAPRTVSLTGGMASSNVFPQILADVLNKPIRRHPPQGSAIGAAVVASRPRADWAATAVELTRRARVVDPDVRGAMEYTESFARWRRLRARLEELSEEL